MKAFDLIKLGVPSLTITEMTELREMLDQYLSKDIIITEIRRLYTEKSRLAAVKFYFENTVHGDNKPSLKEAADFVNKTCQYIIKPVID